MGASSLGRASMRITFQGPHWFKVRINGADPQFNNFGATNLKPVSTCAVPLEPAFYVVRCGGW